MPTSSTKGPFILKYRIVRYGTGAKIFDGDTVTSVTAASIRDFGQKIQNSKAPVILGFQGLSRSQVGRIMQGIGIGREKNITLVGSRLTPKQDQMAILIEPKGAEAWDSRINGRNAEKAALQKRSAKVT